MKLDDFKRILIYGAGVIGSIYGGYLSCNGCGVSVLARGRRLEELRKNGFVYNSPFGERFKYQHAVKAKEEMEHLHQVFYEYIGEVL